MEKTIQIPEYYLNLRDCPNFETSFGYSKGFLVITQNFGGAMAHPCSHFVAPSTTETNTVCSNAVIFKRTPLDGFVKQNLCIGSTYAFLIQAFKLVLKI